MAGRTTKIPQIAAFSCSSTLDGFDLSVKIKIVENRKRLFGAGNSRAKARRSDVRPYTLRVVRDHEGGLWTLEDNEGQLYLAVLSKETTEHRRDVERNRKVRYATSRPSL